MNLQVQRDGTVTSEDFAEFQQLLDDARHETLPLKSAPIYLRHYTPFKQFMEKHKRGINAADFTSTKSIIASADLCNVAHSNPQFPRRRPLYLQLPDHQLQLRQSPRLAQALVS